MVKTFQQKHNHFLLEKVTINLRLTMEPKVYFLIENSEYFKTIVLLAMNLSYNNEESQFTID